MTKRRPNARPITAAFTHDETHLLAVAARAYAAMIDAHDARHPDPDARADAATLARLAAELIEANAARPFINEQEPIQ